MKKIRNTKRLVIDTNIIRSAGEKSLIAQKYRDLLIAILKICHHAVITPPIDKEWTKHASSFSRKWMSWMKSKRKLIQKNPYEEKDFYSQIEQQAGSEKKREAMLKDAFLIDAVIQTDRTILSCDKTVQDLFSLLSTEHTKLKCITWIDLNKESRDTLIQWLQEGAEPREEWMLETT